MCFRVNFTLFVAWKPLKHSSVPFFFKSCWSVSRDFIAIFTRMQQSFKHTLCSLWWAITRVLHFPSLFLSEIRGCIPEFIFDQSFSDLCFVVLPILEFFGFPASLNLELYKRFRFEHRNKRRKELQGHFTSEGIYFKKWHWWRNLTLVIPMTCCNLYRHTCPTSRRIQCWGPLLQHASSYW